MIRGPTAALCLMALLAAVPAAANARSPLFHLPHAQLEPVTYADLNGWEADDHAAAFKTFLASCAAIAKARRPERHRRTVFRELHHICKDALAAGPLEGRPARAFFEDRFRPVRISKLGEAAGFLTGYYEPIVDGSRFPNPEFHTPIYRKPADLVPGGRLRAGTGFPNKGPVGRMIDGVLEPYHDRGEIEDGVFDGKHLEIAWLADPIDAFFMQIQGSGRVRLEDGTMLRVNYVAHNGYPYVPVGRVLIERGHIPREEMSMDRIRQWMARHPREAAEIRRVNRSFVFFRVVGLSADQEAVGAQGVPLTPGRSVAVDRAVHVYGTPFFIEADLPQPAGEFRRLMIGQDTGSAIVGPARGDIYFGAGDEAGRIAGQLRHPGRWTMLVPKGIDPSLGAGDMPLPRARPSAARQAPRTGNHEARR